MLSWESSVNRDKTWSLGTKMTPDEYFLLKFVNSASEVEGRKRLQKSIFLVRFMGCPFSFDYSWHFYGPYSAELALEIDSLVKRGLLVEIAGATYTYRMSESGNALLKSIENHPENSSVVDLAGSWAGKFVSFLSYKVADLEKASSVLFWKQWGKTPTEAIRTTEHFKGKLTKLSREIVKLAQCLQS